MNVTFIAARGDAELESEAVSVGCSLFVAHMQQQFCILARIQSRVHDTHSACSAHVDVHVVQHGGKQHRNGLPESWPVRNELP